MSEARRLFDYTTTNLEFARQREKARSHVAEQSPDALSTSSTDEVAREVVAGDGDAFIYLNGWETDSIVPEATKIRTLGWLRNGEREGWFCVPWREGNIWRGFCPDFLVAREDGERVVVDIIDPHDHTKPDALGKAKGLSDYAGKHADLVGHIDLVAKIGARYRRLHLDQLAIRNKVDALQTLSELRGLYVREE